MGESYSLPYVEPLSKARAPLVDFVDSLLAKVSDPIAFPYAAATSSAAPRLCVPLNTSSRSSFRLLVVFKNLPEWRDNYSDTGGVGAVLSEETVLFTHTLPQNPKTIGPA